MKHHYITPLFITTIILLLSACSTVNQDALSKPVAKKNGFINHFTAPYYQVNTTEDIEDVVVYLPKETTTVRLRMEVANLEDVIYMKLVTEDDLVIDKILRRVEDIKNLGYEQDGYMYEPSIEKDKITLQVYVPSAYLYHGTYKPKLILSFKRNSRSVQQNVNLYFSKKIYNIKQNAKKEEAPIYLNLSEYCQEFKDVNGDFFKQLSLLNENRVDMDMIKDIETSCK